MNDIADKLRAAKALIEDPKNWTQGQLARNKGRKKISPTHPNAICWCAEGAFLKAFNTLSVTDVWKEWLLLMDAQPAAPFMVNDQMGHAAVMAMYDRAIAKAEASA